MTLDIGSREPANGSNLVVVSPSAPAALQETLKRAGEFARAEKAANTRRAYQADMAIFSAWCADQSSAALPARPETVAAFLAGEADRGIRPSTISRRLAAIRYAHRLADLPPPSDDERVRAVMRGIRRSIGIARVPKMPATNDRLLAMVVARDGSRSALRDRALLLLGFAGAFRRSELVALNLNDVEETTEGLRVMIRRSKGDQEGAGATVAIVRGSIACPVEALKAWLAVAKITAGPIFRRVDKADNVLPDRLTAQSVALIVKRYAACAGLDPQGFAGHSLRSGFLTSAARRGASIFKMMDQSRHRSFDTLRGYVRDAELFRDHAGAGLL
jgi:site-specific recombinase XerD